MILSKRTALRAAATRSIPFLSTENLRSSADKINFYQSRNQKLRKKIPLFQIRVDSSDEPFPDGHYFASQNYLSLRFKRGQFPLPCFQCIPWLIF
jgi:hypothetical protein